jgi:hypothetical protein
MPQPTTGFSVDWVSGLDDYGRTVWTVDAHRDGNRFVVRADEKLTAFVELERAIYEFAVGFDLVNHFVVAVCKPKEDDRAPSMRLPFAFVAMVACAIGCGFSVIAADQESLGAKTRQPGYQTSTRKIISLLAAQSRQTRSSL